jgi:hypothetical protein
MLRLVLSSLTLVTLTALPGCTDNSEMPTVPPAPAPGTIKEAPQQTALPEGFMEGKQGKPSPNTPTTP